MIKLKNTAPTIFTVHMPNSTVCLMPGLNTVSDRSIMQHPVVRDKLRKGILVVVQDVQPEPMVKPEAAIVHDIIVASEPVAPVEVTVQDEEKTAGQIVAEMTEVFDIKVLRAFLEHPKKTVVKAAEKQIARINAAEKKKDDLRGSAYARQARRRSDLWIL